MANVYTKEQFNFAGEQMLVKQPSYSADSLKEEVENLANSDPAKGFIQGAIRKLLEGVDPIQVLLTTLYAGVSLGSHIPQIAAVDKSLVN